MMKVGNKRVILLHERADPSVCTSHERPVEGAADLSCPTVQLSHPPVGFWHFQTHHHHLEWELNTKHTHSMLVSCIWGRHWGELCRCLVLTLVRRGQTGLIWGVDGRTELLQLVSLNAELNHVLQFHLIRTVHDVLVILKHRKDCSRLGEKT